MMQTHYGVGLRLPYVGSHDPVDPGVISIDVLVAIGAQWELPGAVGVQWELPGAVARRDEGRSPF
jgi:hypothetical protein